MLRLVTPASGQSLTPSGVVALPVAVQSFGLVVPSDDELRILINRPGETTQLRVVQSRQVEELTPLPVVAAGAARCGTGFVVTGADAQGRAVVLGSLDGGSVAWQHLLEGPQPIRWPVPVCAPQPCIVWQTEHGKLEVADIGETGIAQHRRFDVGGPPLEVASTTDGMWTVWSGASGVFALRIDNENTHLEQVTLSYASDLAAGGRGGGVWIATLQNNAVFVALLGRDGNSLAPPRSIELPDNIQGSLAVVPATRPLIWIQGAEARRGEPLRAKSVLAGPDMQPLEIDGLVYAVAAQGDNVVVLGATELLFLRA